MATPPRSPSLRKRLALDCDAEDAKVKIADLFGNDDVADILLPEAPAPSSPVEDRSSWPLTHGRRTKVTDLFSDSRVHCPVDFQDKLETGVKNGDCLLACFATLLECMSRGVISPDPMHKAAAGMRATVTEYIKSKWSEVPSLNMSMCVSEIMAMAHDVPDERKNKKPWAQRSDQGLEAYSKRCNRVYCCDAEMLMFSNMMFEKGINIVFRAWKWRPDSKLSELVSFTPDLSYFRMHNVDEVYVIDLEHSGKNDGRSAHYKLIEGGALAGLLEVEQRPPIVEPPKKKRRLIKISHMG